MDDGADRLLSVCLSTKICINGINRKIDRWVLIVKTGAIFIKKTHLLLTLKGSIRYIFS